MSIHSKKPLYIVQVIFILLPIHIERHLKDLLPLWAIDNQAHPIHLNRQVEDTLGLTLKVNMSPLIQQLVRIMNLLYPTLILP